MRYDITGYPEAEEVQQALQTAQDLCTASPTAALALIPTQTGSADNG
jgi:hypothetical protein